LQPGTGPNPRRTSKEVPANKEAAQKAVEAEKCKVKSVKRTLAAMDIDDEKNDADMYEDGMCRLSDMVCHSDEDEDAESFCFDVEVSGTESEDESEPKPVKVRSWFNSITLVAHIQQLN
jgi:hypothetical protein